MPGLFEIQSVTVPLIGTDYFTNPLPQYTTISTAELLNRIVSLGANDVRLGVSFGQMDSVTSNTIKPFTTQSIESLKVFTDAAHARGLDITISPIVNFAGGIISGDNTQESHPKPTDPVAWMASFRLAVLEQARIAEAIGAKRLLVMGDTEQTVFQDHPELAASMVSVIGEVRQIFHGQVTVNLYTNSGLLPLFPPSILQALDLIGIGLFPVLTTKLDPTLPELEAAWRLDPAGQDLIANLTRLAETTGKSLWFADTGQSSYDGWLRNSPQKFDPTVRFTADNSEQVLGFQAEFNAVLRYGFPWFKGLSIQNISRIVDDHGLLPAYLASPFGENFYGKPAEQLIRDLFTGSMTLPTVEVRGTNYGETLQGGFVSSTLIAGQADQKLNGGPSDDIFVASAPGQAVAHELKLKLVGNVALGELPTFIIKINGQAVPVDYRVTTAIGGTAASLSIPVFEPGRITSIEIVATNWLIQGAGVNRFLRVQEITLDGANLATLNPTYYPINFPSKPFTGDTNQGGRVVYDTSSLNTAAGTTVALTSNLTIKGDAGVDTVVYGGARAAYGVEHLTDGSWRITKPGATAAQGHDLISGVEVLKFADQAVWIGGDVSMANATSALRIDLRAGAASQITAAGQPQTVTNPTDLANANTGAGNDSIVGGAIDNRIFAGGGNDTVSGGGAGSAAGDYLRGEAGDDSIVGGAGFDDAHGNMGNDTVSTGAGTDYSVGGQGNDLLFGGGDYDLVYGNLGNDTCNGDDGDDIVRGGQDNDAVNGGAGNDYVSGDRGDDTMTGGAGADVFHSFSEAGIDRVTDFSLAEGDRIQLDPGTTYTVAQVGGDTVIQMSGGQLILVGVQASGLPSGAIVVG